MYKSHSNTQVILGVPVMASTYADVVTNAIAWARNRDSRMLVFANVNLVMEAALDPSYSACVKRADMINPDGVPLVWALRLLGARHASRVYGPDSSLELIGSAADNGISIGFYGGTPKVLAKLTAVVRQRRPDVKISYAFSPPFSIISDEENDRIVEEIARSETRILFVGLGCPKQERWIAQNVGRIPAVMLGVGAAFDFIAGSKPQAPRWMMKSGLEWMFRLATEPRRLAGRYIRHNPHFIFLFACQLLFGERRTHGETTE
jgi:N-acetylglucosaminyldiphosphoundecaprenol N-acetyl-beta-D-mannosaminyltransferase